MKSDLPIFEIEMHYIKVRYHIVGKQEELQEIHDLYQTFIQKGKYFADLPDDHFIAPLDY